MAEEKIELRDFNIRQVLPWTELFRSFQVALDPKKLLLAAAGILVMAFGWWLLAAIFYSQSEPKWSDEKYSNIQNQLAKDDPSKSEENRRDAAWKVFKDDRAKWNLLHRAAGTKDAYGNVRYTDAGDLADSSKEYNDIKQPVEDAIKDMEKKGETYRVVGDKRIAVKPYGKLRTWPWEQDRGPNPYLLVTRQADLPENQGLVEWLANDELGVLLEPLVKFLSPVVYMLAPKAGGWNRLYFLLVTLWTLATWALFGGAITRMASVQVARNDKIGMGEAIKFVTARYYSFLSAPVFPLLFVAFMVLLLIIFGFFFMIPMLGDIVIAGIGWPLVFLAGLAMAVVLVGLVGWPMMYATISAEGSDSFDAISRSYSYVYQCPWHYIWYSLVALGYGAVVVFFVGFMGSFIVYLGKWGVSQTFFIESADRDPSFLFVYAPKSFGWRTLLLEGTTVDGDPIVKQGQIDSRVYDKYLGTFQWYNHVGAGLVTVWVLLFFLLILGFGYSYFWSASTIIYLLMRRKVDDTDLDEVYLEEDEAEESYSASVSVPAPSTAPGGGSLQMVDAPSLRTGSAAPTSSPPPAADAPPPEPQPAHSEAPAASGSNDGNPPPVGDGPAANP